MSLLKKLFGGGSGSDASPKAETVTYLGFRITPDPIREGTTYRIAARIEKEVDGQSKTHRLIRADTLEGFDAAVDASVAKAKQMIDEQGERVFN